MQDFRIWKEILKSCLLKAFVSLGVSSSENRSFIFMRSNLYLFIISLCNINSLSAEVKYSKSKSSGHNKNICNRHTHTALSKQLSGPFARWWHPLQTHWCCSEKGTWSCLPLASHPTLQGLI